MKGFVIDRAQYGYMSQISFINISHDVILEFL